MSQPAPLKHITTLWGRWTNPISRVVDSQQRQKSQLLASLLLAGVGLTIITTILRNIAQPYANNQIIAGIINAILVSGLYVGARQGRYRLVALLTSVLASVTIFIAAMLVGGPVGLQTLYYLAVFIVFSRMFLSASVTLAIFALHMVLLAGGGGLIPGVEYNDVLMGAAIFDTVMTIVTLLIVGHHEKWDQEQRSRLVDSDQRHRIIVDMLADYAYVLAVEPDGILRQEWLSESANHLIDLGLDPTRLQDTIQYFHPDDQEKARQHFQGMSSGTIQRDELRFHFRDQEHWLRLTHLPVMDNGRVRQIYGAVQNITGQKIAQQRQFEETLARERYDLVHGFFRAVSHDFRTSLSVIKTNQYLIQTLVSRGEFDQLDSRLSLINEQVDRLTRQLENLKLVSALNSPTEPCNPNDLMQAEIGEHGDAIATKTLEIVFIPDPDAPLIAVNPNEVQRAVGHLLENAIRFSPTAGQVEVRVGHQAEQVLLSITDTGPGIVPEEQERIFEFFYRGDEARSIESGGIGLGLSIAKIVAEAYGGSLMVDSAPGKGSTFTLTIPGV